MYLTKVSLQSVADNFVAHGFSHPRPERISHLAQSLLSISPRFVLVPEVRKKNIVQTTNLGQWAWTLTFSQLRRF